MTPDEARRAESQALANQDEALRQGMEELEARGAADAEELAAAYPADVRPMGGSWYEITFQGAFTYGN